jgi:hypothetical protein
MFDQAPRPPNGRYLGFTRSNKSRHIPTMITSWLYSHGDAAPTQPMNRTPRARTRRSEHPRSSRHEPQLFTRIGRPLDCARIASCLRCPTPKTWPTPDCNRLTTECGRTDVLAAPSPGPSRRTRMHARAPSPVTATHTLLRARLKHKTKLVRQPRHNSTRRTP